MIDKSYEEMKPLIYDLWKTKTMLKIKEWQLSNMMANEEQLNQKFIEYSDISLEEVLKLLPKQFLSYFDNQLDNLQYWISQK